ncbi:ABC transporter ATP-binding protein [Paenactinomyces guangxiensis]|uniref:ABC transporter ATP-binding protein n=1 Tax=Paenactinomyces guangxiensis TaxID=1490290 RepID=A0A7W1WR78_9BACL|nr:ABC transporter ATP-binding protein [Paenactinomyces guangxiensis]MBA4494396.1 ABC transporter ATP-binding protein [Paenactinomyces guangxiensis]MBH8591549.1 ABC transporter ATP-binding protein [Paenactinomyces guangxiensis]
MNVVEMKGITKRFPGTVANDNISLAVKKGEIHALLGENGAGKSTLMNILFGLYQPDEGQILINEKPVTITGPTMANKLGIGMVHQHFMLVQPFSVTENIILGDERSQKGFIDYKTAERVIKELSDRYGLQVDPQANISEISVGMQQRVEILKTLYRGADTLIFDEPTAVLTPQEIEELIEIMRNLVKEGKTIIFITHKLKEIMSACDRVTVIRRGKVIKTLDVSETDEKELAALMVGREVSFTVEKKEANPKETILQVKDLVVEGSRGIRAVDSLDLEVKAGEIVGLAGVDGNGQTELIEAITGLRPVKSGSIQLRDRDITHFKPRKVTEAGLGHIPEDRHKRGLILDFTVSENMVLQTYYQSPFSKGWTIHFSEVDKYTKRLIDEFDVRTPDEHTPIRALSGGNQQKAIIAREVDRDPDLLIAAQPTRGLDVGAIEFIHRRLIEQRDRGKAVLLVSLELDEIMKVSDRVAVINGGRIVGWVDPHTVSEEELGLLMAGRSIQEGVNQ